MRTLRVLIVVIPIVAVGLYFLLQWPHRVQFYAQDNFILNEDFENVRKILVRTDAFERILAANNAKIVDKDIRGLNFATDKILGSDRDWRLELNGYFKVRFCDKRMGSKTVWLHERIQVTPNELILTGNLASSSNEIKGYNMYMHVYREGCRTRAIIRLDLDVEYKAPNIAELHKKIDGEIQLSVFKGVESIRRVFEQVVEEYRGKKWFFNIPIGQLGAKK